MQQLTWSGLPAYEGVLVANEAGRQLSTMSGEKPFAAKVTLPVFMISHACASTIQNLYPYSKGFVSPLCQPKNRALRWTQNLCKVLYADTFSPED